MFIRPLRTVRRTSFRASLFVDAACCLPVFILSMCLLLSLINQAGSEQQAYADMADRADTQVDLIAASGLDIETDVLFQLARPGNGVLLKLIYRPFIGESSRIAESDDELVYIFPKRGIRYHRAGCGTMVNGDIEIILNPSVRSRYKACLICKPASLPDGAFVCMYSESSDVYHRRSCASVTKSFETMTKQEARDQGYTPCLLCLGEEN